MRDVKEKSPKGQEESLSKDEKKSWTTIEMTTILPSPKEVEKIDEFEWIEYTVLPSDTFQGVCVKYKISPTRLRQANGFSGDSLLMAPPLLMIPVKKDEWEKPSLSKDAKMTIVRDKCTEYGLNRRKIRSYLELNDWDVDASVANAVKDYNDAKEKERKQKENEKRETPIPENVGMYAYGELV